jgi:uncharacterized protein YqeY
MSIAETEGSPIKGALQDEMKSAMKAGDKPRLMVVRLALAAIKQVEVDTRETLDDAAVIAVLDKMVKQRRDSVHQYRQGGREDLARAEELEIEQLLQFMPSPLDSSEVEELIGQAIEESGADSLRDMGKVMNMLRPRVQGRVDMAAVSARVKARLAG